MSEQGSVGYAGSPVIGPVANVPANTAAEGTVVLPANATPQQKDAFIMANYGYMSWALAIPEVKAILESVIGPNGLTVDQNAFDGMLRNTSWFKSTTQAMRSWVELQGEDPATAQAQLDQKAASIHSEAATMGLTLDDNAVKDMSLQSIAYGWDKSMLDQALYAETMRQTFAGTAQGFGSVDETTGGLTGSGKDSTTEFSSTNAAHNGPMSQITGDPFGGGTLSAYYSKIEQLAAQYMVTLSPSTVTQWAIQQATGQLDPTAVQGNLVSMAIGKFPTLKAQIESGMTPAQMFDPIKQAVAKTLEISPDQVDWQDPKYGGLFQYVVPPGNPGAGTVRPMTEVEATNWARQQDDWTHTQNAQAQGATMVKTLLNDFGAAKN